MRQAFLTCAKSGRWWLTYRVKPSNKQVIFILVKYQTRQPINSLHCLQATPTTSHDSQSTPFTTYTPRPPRHDSQSTPFSAYTPRPPHHMTANQLSSPPTRHAHLITWQPISFLHCLHATPTSSHDSQSTLFTAYMPRPHCHMTANKLSSLPTCHAHLITWQPINSLQCLQAMPTSSHDSQSTPLTAYKPCPPRHMTANQLPWLPTSHAHHVTWQPINSLQCLQATPTSSHDSQSTLFTAYNQKLDAKQSPILTHLAAPLAAYTQWINSVDKKNQNWLPWQGALRDPKTNLGWSSTAIVLTTLKI